MVCDAVELAAEKELPGGWAGDLLYLSVGIAETLAIGND